MNLILDDKPQPTSLKRKILLISILVICLIAILVGAYVQVFKNTSTTIKYTELSDEQYEELTTKFETIFLNSYYDNSNKSNSVSKIDNQKEIIYSEYTNTDNVDGKYSLNVNIPCININSEIIKKYNEEIKSTFETKAQSILNSSNTANTIYTVEYIAFINGDILSLAIRSNLKEGNNAQRVIIQTYNYNLSTNKAVTIDDVLETKGITKNYAESKVREKIKEEARKVEELKQLGYNIFDRDYNSSIYEMNNTTEFFIGENGNIYLIYAYGNTQYTSELDVVIF